MRTSSVVALVIYASVGVPFASAGFFDTLRSGFSNATQGFSNMWNSGGGGFSQKISNLGNSFGNFSSNLSGGMMAAENSFNSIDLDAGGCRGQISENLSCPQIQQQFQKLSQNITLRQVKLRQAELALERCFTEYLLLCQEAAQKEQSGGGACPLPPFSPQEEQNRNEVAMLQGQIDGLRQENQQLTQQVEQEFPGATQGMGNTMYGNNNTGDNSGDGEGGGQGFNTLNNALGGALGDSDGNGDDNQGDSGSGNEGSGDGSGGANGNAGGDGDGGDDNQ